jgi:3-deoxy-manno-octulosonate cytidylyltransferase (CMP-KDO synthetase)
MTGQDFIVVIPARYGSSRLPGKPLLQIAGRPMVEHVWLRARESGAREVIVATDDERIMTVVQRFGGRAVMTSSAHASGTDRLAQVARNSGWDESCVVVNLQGDEPLMPGRLVAEAAAALCARPEASISTLAVAIEGAGEMFDANVVKVVLDARSFALYFSRAPIPWVRDRFATTEGRVPLPSGVPVLRHVGLYAYRVGELERLSRAPVAPIEAAESLEQLRALSMGMRVFVSVVGHSPGRGVDKPDDVAAVARLLANLAPA